jgi:hypothetical protein
MIDPLGIVVEFSIGLAGFTGIVAIFANSQRTVSAAVRFRITNLLFTAFAPGFFSLLVISLLQLGVSGEIAVRAASALFAASILTWAMLATRSRSRLPASDRRLLSNFIYWFTAAVALSNASAQVLGALAILANPAGVLVAGLSAMLFLGAVTFAALVMQVLGREHVDERARGAEAPTDLDRHAAGRGTS